MSQRDIETRGPWALRNAAMAWAPGTWVGEAICSETDPELFFPEKGKPAAMAKLVCRRCPVLEQCREYAVNAPMVLEGVWGGTTVRERRELRRDRGIRTSTAESVDLCGTPAGAKRHYRAGQVPCVSCRRAEERARAERAARA